MVIKGTKGKSQRIKIIILGNKSSYLDLLKIYTDFLKNKCMDKQLSFSGEHKFTSTNNEICHMKMSYMIHVLTYTHNAHSFASQSLIDVLT